MKNIVHYLWKYPGKEIISSLAWAGLCWWAVHQFCSLFGRGRKDS